MAANSALCLVMAGLALLPASGAAAPPRRHSTLGMALAGSLICAIVLVALLGYLTNIEAAYRGGHFNKMGANTAVSLLLIGAGILTLSLSDAGGGRVLHRSWVPALVLGVVTVRTLLLWQAIQSEQNVSRVQASQTTASQIGVRVRMSTESLAADVMRLERRWPEYSPAGDAGWQQDAQSYCRDYPGLRAVEWVGESIGKRRVAGRIASAWSPKLLEIQAETLQSARRRKAAVASIILDIGQGKRGFLVVAPGLEPGPSSYTTAMIEIQPWLVSIIGNQTALQYGVVVTAGGAEVYRRGSSQPQAIDRAEAQSDVGLAGAGWIVHAWPGSDTSSLSESSLATWVLVAGLVVAAALALAAHLARLSYDRAKAVEAANRNMEIEILERKLAEESLLTTRLTAEEATRAKTDFLSRMSHEIRTPMNAILGMAELLWDSRLDDEQRQYVGAFRRAGDNLLTLINEILDLSKIEAGRIELQSVDFELDELVGAAIDLMRVRADDKSLDIVCEISPQIGLRVRGDPAPAPGLDQPAW